MQNTKNAVIALTFLFHLVFLIYPCLSRAINDEECFACHGDKAISRTDSEGMSEGLYVDPEKFAQSVHSNNGITCVDCHSDIQELNYDEAVPHPVVLMPVRCDTCHEAEGQAYQNSVHKKAGRKGITMVCYSCHEYHYVVRLGAASVAERENEFCLKCHNPDKFHDWLPQKDTHFSHVECAICHAPKVPRHIQLKFYDLIDKKFLCCEEILTLLNIKYDDVLPMLDKNKDGIINVNEFEDLLFILRQKGIRTVVHAELVAELNPLVHQVNRGGAQGTCELCHTPTSPFFEDVIIVFPKADRSMETLHVERAVLETYYLRHFYAIAGTRIRLLDKIGLVMLVGGAGVVFAHLIVRIFTIPLRRQRKEDESEF